MDFNIITPADLAKGGTIAGGTRKQRDPDDWISRLTKEIPAEVIAVYLTIAAIIKSISNSSEQNILFWVIFIILVVLTPFYQWRVKKIKKWLQIGLSTGAFIIWVFTLGGPFAQFTWYTPAIGALILPIYTLVLAIVKP